MVITRYQRVQCDFKQRWGDDHGLSILMNTRLRKQDAPQKERGLVLPANHMFLTILLYGYR